MTAPQCVFTTENNEEFRLIEVSGKRSGDFNANVVNVGNITLEINKVNEDVFAVIKEGATGAVLIGEAQLNIEVEADKPLTIREFNGLAPCDRDRNFNLNGIDFECRENGNILESQEEPGGANYDLIQVVESIFDCPIAIENRTRAPIFGPTANPSISPTLVPTANPTVSPSFVPTDNPSANPTFEPTTNPTANPTFEPTSNPTANPSAIPSTNPSVTPTSAPTANPSVRPTASPTMSPTNTPREPLLATLDLEDYGLLFGIMLFFLSALVLVSRQRRQYQQSRILEREQEGTNLALGSSRKLNMELTTHGFYQSSAGDDNISLSSGITELQKRRSGGVESMFTLQTMNTTLTDRDKANHMKVRSVISGYTKYSQVTEMMLELNDLAKLKGEARKKSFIHGVVTVLNRNLVENAEQIDDQLSEFDAQEKPDISLSFYLLQLIEGVNFWYEPTDVFNATIGIRSMLLALHFLRKMKDSLGFKTTTLNIHKTLSILLLLSAKFIEDKPLSNSYWAAIAGIEAREISKLEDVFCFSVGFDFSIDQTELNKSLSPYDSFTL